MIGPERTQGWEPEDTISAMDFSGGFRAEDEWDYDDFYRARPAPLNNVIDVKFVREEPPDLAA